MAITFVKTREARWLGNGYGNAPVYWSVRVDGEDVCRMVGGYFSGRPAHRLSWRDTDQGRRYMFWLHDMQTQGKYIKSYQSRVMKAAVADFLAQECCEA